MSNASANIRRIATRAVLHDQRHHCPELIPVRHATAIFAECCFPRVAAQGKRRLDDDANLGLAHTAEKFLGRIRACAVQAVSLLVIIMRFIGTAKLSASHDEASSAWTVVPCSTRDLMKFSEACSEPNVAGIVRPFCSRITTTTLRLPF